MDDPQDLAPITFEQYLAWLRKHVDDFESYWLAKMAAEPDKFPEAMEPGEWDSQFEAYTGDLPEPD